MAATTYRATRNEPRVGVGDWTGDFRAGTIYMEVPAEYEFDDNGDPVLNPDGTEKLTYARISNGVPDYICSYLVSHGLLVDSRVSTVPANSPLPTGPQRPTMATVTPIGEDDDED